MRQIVRRLSTLLLFAVVFFAGAFICAGEVQAASLNIVEINYENSTLTLESKQGDLRGFFRKKGQSKWETMSGYFKDGKITMDISFISQSSNYNLSFKGDISTDEKTVVIPKASKGPKVAYNASAEADKSPVRITNANDRVVQWRKNNGITWSEWDNKTAEKLNYLIANGSTLYFRLAPKNGTSVDKNGQRASKEVSLKIAAKKAAPDVKFDDSAFTVSLKSGMLYRIAVMNNDGVVDDAATKEKEWEKITSTREYSLTELCNTALNAECALQFKNGYKGNSQESRVKTLIIPKQEALSEAEKAGIEISYTSTKNFDLKLSGASDTKPYQYCIVKKEDYNNGKLPYNDLKWTDVKTTAPVSISKTKAPEGSRIYVRKKACKSIGEEGYSMSSKEVSVTGDNGISYPGELGFQDFVKYCIPAGRVNTGDYGTSLTFTIKSYVSTKVSKIVFCNASGGEVGEVGFVSTVAQNSGKTASDDSDKYIITTKITDTAPLEKAIENLYNSQSTNYYGSDLYAKITLANDSSAHIESTDTKGIVLNLTPRSKIDNPSSVSENGYNIFKNHYLNSVSRLYMCSYGSNKISNTALNADGEDKYFKFILNLGSADYKEVDNGNSMGLVKIESITYDDCELFKSHNEEEIGTSAYSDSNTLKDVVFDVTYQNYQDKYGNANARRAFVTVNLAKMETELAGIKGSNVKMNKAIPLVITLNNKEVLDSEINITMQATATVDGGNIYYTDTAGSLPEPYEEKTFDKNGNVTKTTKVVPVEHTFTLKLFKSGYEGGAVMDVTFGENGKSILQSAKTVGDTITIELSNKRINSLGSGSENLYIKFKNGFIIKNGCRLTILDGVSKSGSLTGTSQTKLSKYQAWLGDDVSGSVPLMAASDTEAAPEASNVEVTEIDYNALTLTVDSHNNDIVYFSVNKTAWNEMDALLVGEGKLMMDISWISPSSEKKLYFKGNRATAITTVTLPKLNNKLKAKFDGAEGNITLSNYEDATQFLWRKDTDYNWKLVDIDDNSPSYKNFLAELEGLRVMGGKIYIMTGQVKGSVVNGSLNTGERPSKQVKVSIKKRPNMPNVNLNIKSLTFNTSNKMEYYDENTKKWIACEKKMRLDEITKLPFENKNVSEGAVILQFRKAATSSSGESKVRIMSVPYQAAAPKQAEAISAYIETRGSGSSAKKKLVISFPIASVSNPVEYFVSRPGEEFNDSKASWKTVKDSGKLIKLSEKSAPEGTKVYIRYKGVKENEKKGIALKLPSAYVLYNVTYK